jgi:hypothetical protein
MTMMIDFGRIMLIIGLALALVGGIILLASRFFPWMGNLPGDFSFESGNMKIYVPLATMLLISILGTLLLNIFLYIFRR